MVLDGEQVYVIATQGIQHQIITADVLAQTGIFPKSLFEVFQAHYPFHGLRQFRQKIHAYFGKAFEIRDHRLEKLFEQGSKLPGNFLFFEKPANVRQVFVEILCDADSAAAAHPVFAANQRDFDFLYLARVSATLRSRPASTSSQPRLASSSNVRWICSRSSWW